MYSLQCIQVHVHVSTCTIQAPCIKPLDVELLHVCSLLVIHMLIHHDATTVYYMYMYIVHVHDKLFVIRFFIRKYHIA